MIKKSTIALAALTVCGSALADPVSIFTAVANWYGANMLLAHVAVLVVTTAYTSAQARRQQRKAEAEARARHNESLEDRSITVLSASPAHRTVYGRCIVGGDIMAVFHTDKQGVDAKGKSYTKKDGYKHVVIRIADHEVEAIHGAYWGGVAVGPLSVIGTPTYAEGNGGIPVGQTATSGWSTLWTEEREIVINGDTKLPYKAQNLISAVDTAGVDRLSLLTLSSTKRRVTGPSYDVKLKYLAIRDDFTNADTPIQSITLPGTTTSYTLPGVATVSSVVSAWYYQANEGGVDQGSFEVTVSTDRRTMTFVAPNTGGTITLSYAMVSSESKLKFSFHRGSPDQVPDAYLMSILPEKWTSNHLLVGKAYAVVTFDLEDSRFQGGPTEISFDVSGKRLFDPRTGTTYFSRNNALVANDYLKMRSGVNIADEFIEQSYLVASANVCDIDQTFTETDTKWGTVKTTTEKLYTFNGLVTSDEGREAVLAGIAQSMAGSIVDSSQWLIIAGAWSAPVMDLTEDDLFGSIEVVQGDNGGEDTFNAVRGRYTPAGLTQPTDITPYINSTLVTADGAELFDNLEFKYTDSNARCVNLARIHTELSRTGLVIKFPAKLSAWPLQIGDRVRVKTTDANFGFDYKHFRVTDWQHTLQSPVLLKLQEDEAETYDTIDTALADPTRDITLPNPWSLDPITGIVIESGTAHLVLNSSGSVMVRALVSWDEPADAYVANGAGRVEVWYRSFTSEGLPESTWYSAKTSQGQNSVYLNNLTDQQLVEVQLYSVNSLGVVGPSTFMSHVVVGRTEPPSNVSGLTSSVNQGIIPWSWDYPSDLDYEATEIRAVDAHWGSLDIPPLWRGKVSSWTESVTFAGNFTRYFRHVDTGGRTSVVTSTRTQAVDVSELGPDVTTYRLDISPVTGVLYTDYRGVVNNFSTANAAIRVKKSDGSDDTIHWTLTKSDSGVVTSMTSGGDLTVISFPTNMIEEAYYGTMLRAPMKTSHGDVTSWGNALTQASAGYVATFSSSGGPFADTGYLQLLGAGGATNGVKYGPNPNFLSGFRTSWSMSAWMLLTELPNQTFYILSVGTAKTFILQRGADVAGQPRYQLSATYFGYTTPGGATSSATGSVTTISSPLTSTDLPLDEWMFVEVSWSASEKKLRIFKGGVLLATNTASTDLATYVDSYTYSTPAGFFVYAGVSAGYEVGNPANPLRNGRLADVDYTYGGSVHIADYTVPSGLRSTKSFVSQSSALITATAGSSVLEGTYTINTVEGAPALIQVVSSRSSGVIKSNWEGADYDYSGAVITFQVLVNSRNDTNNWDIFINQYGTTASLSFSASNTTKTVTVTGKDSDNSDAYLNVVLSNPNYPTQYIKFPISRQKDAKPAQTSNLSKTSIVLAGDYNGTATDFSQATTQGTMYEGGVEATGWSWSASVTSGITYTHSNGLVTITAMDAAVDQGSITLTATKSGWTTTTLRCEVLKSKLLLPASQPVATIPAISVLDSGVSSALAEVKFKANGEIQKRVGVSGSFTNVGVWYNPTTGTPGTSHRIFSQGVWYPLSSDVVISANPNISDGGNGVSAMYDGTYVIATNASTTPLGTGRLFLWATIESGGA